jgi:hypothetical protein
MFEVYHIPKGYVHVAWLLIVISHMKMFKIRSALFWGIMQRRVVIIYRRFGATYRSHLQGSRNPLSLEDGTDTLSRSVSKGLPLEAALYPTRAQFTSASRRKHEITDVQD